MKVFAVYNLKGGVGKTTCAVNFSYLSASQGARTLIWDLDPQGGTSYYLCIKPKVEGGVKELVKGKTDLHANLRMTGFPNLDLLPADFSFRNIDKHLNERKDPLHVFQKVIKPLSGDYDHLVLDCAPGLSTVTENVLQIADVLLVPLIPTTLSLRAYNRLVQFLVKHRKKKMKVIPFFTMVNGNKPIHQVVVRNVREKHPIFINNSIPESSLIEAMGVKRSPLFTFARESSEAAAFKGVWQEINDRINADK